MTREQIAAVRTLVKRHFGDDAEVWLFGSRADDAKKGGDYDLLVETSLVQPDVIIALKIAFIAGLQSTAFFEDEKIDVVVKRRASRFELPIYSVARTEGVRL
ncbi:MAG: nucleotidyltransferase domain-containing protein [Deltaproteobacteria bacterium]|nr:nucleotidyltransferase domain-containing protein [Deltaproteobacteria bacterium]